MNVQIVAPHSSAALISLKFLRPLQTNFKKGKHNNIQKRILTQRIAGNEYTYFYHFDNDYSRSYDSGGPE